MTKEELKALGLTEDQIDKIFEDYGKNYVPKSQFNEKLEALKHAEEDKKNAAKELDELKKQIEDLQQATKDRKKSDEYLFESGGRKFSGLKPGESRDDSGEFTGADIFAKALG